MKLSLDVIAVMIHIIIRLSVAVLVVFSSVYSFQGHSTFVIRSQSDNSAQAITSWMNYAQEQGQWPGNGVLQQRLGYEQSCESMRIARYLMGKTQLTFSGSRVRDRGEQDVLADYFGLPSDFQSKVMFSPRIQTVLYDVVGYKTIYQKDCGEYKRSAYVSLHLPLVYTRWDMRLQETVVEEGVNFHPAGYMGAGARRLVRDDLVPNVKTALQGRSVFGDMLEPLRFGKISGERHMTAISDVQVAMGLTIESSEDRIGSIFVQLGMPTGTRRNAEFLFEPQIGNNHHWELGLGAQGYLAAWRDCLSCYALVARIYLAHLFSTTQKRSFDVQRNGKGSRYMLLQTMGRAVNNTEIPAGTLAKTQYQGLLLPALHATTLDTDICIDVQGDATLALRASRNNWDVDAGYSLWLRSGEKITARKKIPADRYAVKGDGSLYGFTVVQVAIALNATQHEATLHAGQGLGNVSFKNLNADNAAVAADGLAALTGADAGSLGIPAGSAHGSNMPLLISDADVNEASALAPAAATHTFFAQCSYYATTVSDRDLYLGLGARIEVAGRSEENCSVASQWGIWLLTGLSY